MVVQMFSPLQKTFQLCVVFPPRPVFLRQKGGGLRGEGEGEETNQTAEAATIHVFSL